MKIGLAQTYLRFKWLTSERPCVFSFLSALEDPAPERLQKVTIWLEVDVFSHVCFLILPYSLETGQIYIEEQLMR